MSVNLIEGHLIKYIRERSQSDSIPGLGIGDDAAFLLLSSMEESKLIVSTDSVVENVHFKNQWCSYSDAAVKLIERSSSDILAKGGHPHWALLNMNITEEFAKEKSLYGAFIDTFCENLRTHNIALIGGDITRSAVNTFTMTVLGNASTFIRRKNNEVTAGDLVVMYGKAGGSSFALDIFLSGKTPDEEIANYYRRPQACWENEWIKNLSAKVSIDQSDSLYETFEILADENTIHMDIDLEKIPLSMKLKDTNVEMVAAQILKSAEDLAIIAIVPESSREQINQYQGLTVIGNVVGTGMEKITYKWNGKPILMDNAIQTIYKHF